MKKNRIVLYAIYAFGIITLIGPISTFAQDPNSNDPKNIDETEVIDQIIEEDLDEGNFEEVFREENIEEDFDDLQDERYVEDPAEEYYFIDGPGGNVNHPLEELFTGFGIFFTVVAIWIVAAVFIAIPFYIYYSLAAYTIGQKLGIEGGWMAWVPIFNLYYYVKLSGLEFWWFILLFIPFVNIFAQIYVWMKIAARRGFDEWLGLLMLVPFVNFFIPGYLAWGSPPDNKPTK